MSMLDLANSRLGPWLGMAAARLAPRRAAYALADRVAAHMAGRSGGPQVQAVRANQAIVRGLAPGDPGLDQAAQEVLRVAGRGYVDLFRALGGGLRGLLESCTVEASLDEALRAGAPAGRGVIAVSGHMSCFDILMITLAARGYPVRVLSYATPRGSYHTQNALRRRYGLEITPISPTSLRQAFRDLKQGRLVATGIDRPVPEGEPLRFFGRPTVLPIGHARLAIRTGALIVLGIVLDAGPGRYRAIGAGVVDPQAMGADGADERAVAQAVLDLLEPQIRARPADWAMFHPLWPELLESHA